MSRAKQLAESLLVMTIFTQKLLVIFCCTGNCPFHSNMSSWSNLKNGNINRCKTSQHLKSQLQVLEINCGSSWWQEVLPLHLTTTHSVRYTQSVVSHALPRNTTSRVGFSPRLFVFVRGSSLSATCLYPLSLFLLTLSSLPHISIVKRTLVNQMWHFQCSLLLSTKDGNNATRNTKTGKQKVWERGLSECQSEVPKTAESNKETFDLPPYPCQVAQIPDPRSLGILTRRGRTYMRHRPTKAAWPPPTITNILAFVPHLFWNIFLPTPAVLVTV